jgi:hypothetical protein
VRVWILCALLLALTASRLHAEAGPPLITDDPGTPERGKWEINLAFTYDQNNHRQDLDTPLVDSNYGLTDHVQLKLEIPWETTAANDSGHHPSGLGESIAGVKWRFLDEDKSHVSMSIYPQVAFGWGSLKISHDGEPHQTHLLLPFEVQKELGPVTVGLEYGVDLQGAHKPRDFAGLTLGHTFKERFDALAEIRQTSDLTLHQLNAIVNGGFRIKINDTISLLGSVGTAIRRSDRDQSRLFSYFGIQFRF